VTVPAPTRGDLYWRLAGDREPAGHARFLPEVEARERPVNNVVSEGRLSTTIHFQGAAPALTLAFGSAGERWRVRVARAAAPEKAILERIVTEPRCEIAAGILAEGSYVWAATPIDDEGRAQGHRPSNKLELAYENARSTLAITRLTEAEVQGVAPLGAQLFINGNAAPVDEKGRFAMKVSARLLVFRLLAADGSESYWVRSPGARRKVL
jgi:hypothetical protein